MRWGWGVPAQGPCLEPAFLIPDALPLYSPGASAPRSRACCLQMRLKDVG